MAFCRPSYQCPSGHSSRIELLSSAFKSMVSRYTFPCHNELRIHHRQSQMHRLSRLHGGVQAGARRSDRCQSHLGEVHRKGGISQHAAHVFSVQRCNHCADAPCVEICPVSALWTRNDGIVDFDGDRCIGCKACMQACPYDAHLHQSRHEHRGQVQLLHASRGSRASAQPCVNVCPEHAIIAGDMDDPTTEIAPMLARHQVQVRKPEKGTRPKVFYIDGDAASLQSNLCSTPEGLCVERNSKARVSVAPPRLEQAESKRAVSMIRANRIRIPGDLRSRPTCGPSRFPPAFRCLHYSELYAPSTTFRCWKSLPPLFFFRSQQCCWLPI